MERNEVNIDVCIILLMKAEYKRIRNPTAQNSAPLEQPQRFPFPLHQNSPPLINNKTEYK